MELEAPGASEAMLRMEHNSQNDVTPPAHVAMDSTSKDPPHVAVEDIGDDISSHQAGRAVTQSETEGIEKHGHNDVESKSTQESTDEPRVQETSSDFPKLSADMERYIQLEAFLLKHRKDWESNNTPRVDALLRPRRDRPPNSDPEFAVGPWSYEWELSSRNATYKRPNPFELTNDLSAFHLSQSAEEKDEFDRSIDYAAARGRLRKNFEWDLDRLFLVEEIAIRKRKQEEDAKRRTELDRAEGPNAATKDKGEGGPDNGDDKKIGPALKLNFIPWFTFKRLSSKLETEACVVDVLVGNPIIDDNMGSMFARRVRRSQAPRHSDLDKAMNPGQAPLPERIRITSGVLKRILAGMLSADISDFGETASFVIVRPFKSLFHCYDNIKAMIENLEEKFSESQASTNSVEDDARSKNDVHAEKVDGDEQRCDPQGKDSGSVDVPEKPPSATEPQTEEHGEPEEAISEEEEEDSDDTDQVGNTDDPIQSKRALRHLTVLREFMDTEIETKRTYLQRDECRKVFFTDLWYLFRPGQEVVSRDGKQAYRIIHVSSQRHRKLQPWDAWRWYNVQGTEEEKKKKKNGPFSVTCVYIDFDGHSIGPVPKTFDFKQFDGQAEITSLPVYPIRLHPLRKSEVSDDDWRALESLAPGKRYRQHLINRGASFLKVLGIKPMYYAGPTLGVRDDIESQVVIDFETAFSAEDEREETSKPSLEMIIGEPVPDDDEREFDTACRADCCRLDSVYNDNYIDDKQRSRYVNSLLPSSDGRNTQPSIAVFPQPLAELKDTANKTGYSISDDELVIMSYRVFGFVLRHRQWAQLDLTYLTELHAHWRPMQGPQNRDGKFEGGEYRTAFDNLVLEEKQKPMIQALVAQHFRDKEHKAGQASQMDIVKGKGKGLILLLHGAPGVGKTSTAEGVAELFNRPLFQITCGDLGTTAKEVEKALDLNFTLANRWDCILLLDEADVFLAQRNKEDFQRNGLVAVFLRVLEYYAGVLFLTTNRIGDFDEAFTSRIHVSLYYPGLNHDKTMKVFNINIKMIEERFRDKGRNIVIDDISSFADNHFNTHKKARWNGRQIRNACQTALALAEFEAQGNSHTAVLKPDAVVHLKVSHFETVQKAYLDFTHYMDTVYGSSTETRAQEGKVRAILDLMNESTDNAATGIGTVSKRKEDFANAARVKREPLQQPATPVTQPAVQQPQSPVTAQPLFQPMYAPGNQQYTNTAVPPQVYYQAPMYPQYAQQMMGMPQMQQQQQLAVPSQSMQFTQPQINQPQSMMSQNVPQAWNSPVSNPESNNTQEPRAIPEVPPRTPPSQSQQAAHPQQHQVASAVSPWFGRNIQNMYSASSPQATGAGYPQQQHHQHQQQGSSSSGGEPPPLGQTGGPSGAAHPAGAPLSHGQWPGPQGFQYTGGSAQ